jgi:tRNA 2-thiocytidine biosynthesis protein TtcA
MLQDWEKKYPRPHREHVLGAAEHRAFAPDGRRRYDFKGLKVTGVASDDGDKAFDEDTFTVPTLPGLQVVPI